jgi:hypothetical protein
LLEYWVYWHWLKVVLNTITLVIDSKIVFNGPLFQEEGSLTNFTQILEWTLHNHRTLEIYIEQDKFSNDR